MTEPTAPLGVIVDTNSGGSFGLIVYEDGILGVKRHVRRRRRSAGG
jgi:hypothetical protein